MPGRIGQPPGPAERLEPSPLGVYPRPTLLQRDRVTAPDVEVEVQAILGHLPLRHALEVDARPDAFGILHGVGVVPPFLVVGFGPRPVVPARETVGGAPR